MNKYELDIKSKMHVVSEIYKKGITGRLPGTHNSWTVVGYSNNTAFKYDKYLQFTLNLKEVISIIFVSVIACVPFY